MKNISIYIDDISKKGGTERVASFLANYLSSNGWHVKIVSLNKNNSRNFYSINNSVKIDKLEKNTLLHLMKYMKYDLSEVTVSISMGRLSSKMAFAHKILGLRSRLILSEHVGFDNSNFLVKLVKLISYRCANDLVLLTSYDLNKLKEVVNTNIIKIVNPSSFQSSRPEIIKSKSKIVLAVGRLTYQKNFHDLIRIWASIDQKENWILKVVGDGEDYESLNRLVDELSLKSTVVIVGSTKNIEVEFEQASIIAMTSRFEGLPLVLIEAKSFGVASVAFDCRTGPAEIIQDGEDGFLIPFGDDVCFSQRLQCLMTDKDKLSRMQHSALKNAEKFSMQSVGQDWERLLNSEI